ncbi:MAG: hypothetical protein K2P54_05730, partial [Odoribacter sp.]|nr:hypothetical protein [Odoribacter sp.]
VRQNNYFEKLEGTIPSSFPPLPFLFISPPKHHSLLYTLPLSLRYISETTPFRNGDKTAEKGKRKKSIY